MNYTLAVLTHGDSETLEPAVESFLRNVVPAPSYLLILRDGPGWSYVPKVDCSFYVGQVDHASRGFCEASRKLWTEASREPTSHVFWLEHDFVFHRSVDLDILARVMAAQTAFVGAPLAQMALMRDAVNDREKVEGGLYESRRDEYRQEGMWLSHTSYFTTNPSLMTAGFMRANPWPDYESNCEGLFGMDMVEAGYRFGVWGDGSPWVEHIGRRSGFGY